MKSAADFAVSIELGLLGTVPSIIQLHPLLSSSFRVFQGSYFLALSQCFKADSGFAAWPTSHRFWMTCLA